MWGDTGDHERLSRHSDALVSAGAGPPETRG